MPIDMRGWSVVYENQVYRCLTVEPVCNGDRNDKGFERPVHLRVTVIDHEARFLIIENYETRFQFLREAPPHE